LLSRSLFWRSALSGALSLFRVLYLAVAFAGAGCEALAIVIAMSACVMLNFSTTLAMPDSALLSCAQLSRERRRKRQQKTRRRKRLTCSSQSGSVSGT